MNRFGKNLIRAAVCAAVIALLFGMTACKELLADIEEDFSYWAAEAVVDPDIVISPNPSYASGSSIPCVPSSGPVTVTLKVRNPKNFSFIMPNSPGAPTDIVRFEDGKVKGSLGSKPVYGTDYTLVPSSDGKELNLTYNAAFLQANEWGSANIGAAITLYSTDGRKFNQTYKFDLEANTPPPDPSITFAKTTGSPSYYVLCIAVPNMPGAVVNGKPLHKDIAHIAINDDEYDLKMNTGNTDFVRPGSSSFITTGVVSLDGSGTPMTPGNWVLYYKTPTPMGSPQASYTVTLKDAKGLRSQASATTPTVPITEWGALRTAVQAASDGAVITVGSDITYDNTGTDSIIVVTKSITVKSNVSGTKRTLNAGGTGANASTENAKSKGVFEVDGSGITLTLEDLTLTKTEKYAVYVHNGASLEMNKVTIEDCKTNFNAAGIYFYEGKDLSITNSVIKKCNGKGGFSAGGIDIQAPQADGTLSFTGTTFENCKAVGTSTYKGDGGGIHIYEGLVTLTGCTFTGCEAKNGGGIYLSGNASCTLDSVTMQGNTAPNGKGSAVYVAKTASDTPTLTLKGNVQIGISVPNSNTLCLGYAVNGSTIQTAFVSATSADLNASARINIEPEDYIKQSNRYLIQGTGIGLKAGLFHLTNTPSGETWMLTNSSGGVSHNNGLQLQRTSAKLIAPVTGSWKALKEAVQSMAFGGILTIDGTFTATSGDNSGEIVVNKSLTIKGDPSAVIDADNKCRIFKLGGFVTLEKITLLKGNANSPSEGVNGGGIYVTAGNSITLKDCIIDACKAGESGGGIYLGNIANLDHALKNTRIINCIANISNVSEELVGGGAIYFSTNNGNITLVMDKDSSVPPPTGTDADKPYKNDIFLIENAKINLTGGAFAGNGPIARITPQKEIYVEGHQVLEGDITVGPSSKKNYQRFRVTPEVLSGGTTKQWYVDSDGKLTITP